MSSYAPYHSAVEAAEENFVEECVLVAMLTLVVYEYAVTLDREVDVVWRRRPTAPSAMLLVSRWLMLLGPIAGNIPITSVARFEGIWRLTVITYALSLTVVAAFSALRVYAILLRGRLRYAVPALVGALGLVPVATNTYKWARTTLVPVPPGGYTVIALSEALETSAVHGDDERDRARSARARDDVGEVVRALPRDAQAAHGVVCHDDPAARRDAVFCNHARDQPLPAADVQHDGRRGQLLQHLHALPPAAARAALHAEPAPAHARAGRGERKQLRGRAGAAPAVLPGAATEFPGQYRRAARARAGGGAGGRRRLWRVLRAGARAASVTPLHRAVVTSLDVCSMCEVNSTRQTLEDDDLEHDM
ncbi:hypothetical protein PsYK624_125430 [Phanerochaete sordida]|uniref:DUF6533 domain-containing protein n=1 Tax=Phanerochaete sordida TaxID=48140 RepID=A0A9P3GMX1_9APHY|nr:hypothetical protein PsYK624_125430 [Phanerochaete sordida]